MTEDLPADEPRVPPEDESGPELELDPDATIEIAFLLPAQPFEAAGAELRLPLPPDPSATETAPAAQAGTSREAGLALNALGERLERRLDELKALIQREIRAEATREKVVDRLHAELQEYKQDLLLNTLRPMFIDLIQLHDDIGKVAVAPSTAQDDGHPEVRRLVGLMEGFQQGIEDILYRQGVEPFQVEGDVFDPRRQRAVATLATEDPALNKTVAVRHRKGFRSGDRVIRPEIVSVFAPKK
jgi:molecular chaperone GrpE